MKNPNKKSGVGADRWRQWLSTGCGLGVLVLLLPGEAQAYTDPGSGAFLMQTALAAVAGSLFFLKVIRARIAAFFRNDKETDQVTGKNTKDHL